MTTTAAIDPATGDRILRDARTSWWVLWPRLALALLAAAVAAWGATLQDTSGYALVAAGALVGLWALAGALLRRAGSRIRLTDRCVIVQSGLVSRHTSTVMLDRIESLDLDQSLWQRMTGTGTLTIRGVGSEDVRFVGMQDPAGFQADARRAINEFGAVRPARREPAAA
jgi:uncharacterized membrane protein YdbT with pleckstrin-like domain